ncbi:hypothetical protein BDFB_005543 [Asbolus verrucosus]|uniref:Uncharacterized protein n=1 Tax=Asbolus verrucosus TaxID=1661398 RepID=A0A482VYL0_ASBVE|nr:hypothetical protein BDFB_005543 [Asbolus verrucosus]
MQWCSAMNRNFIWKSMTYVGGLDDDVEKDITFNFLWTTIQDNARPRIVRIPMDFIEASIFYLGLVDPQTYRQLNMCRR